MRLAVMHNLHFYNELMARIRQALDEGALRHSGRNTAKVGETGALRIRRE